MLDPTILSYFSNAGPVVKIVMLLLLVASIFSWALIFQRITFLKHARKTANDFEQQFWSGADLHQLYHEASEREGSLTGHEQIFYAGFKEYLRLQQKPGLLQDVIMERVERAMRIACNKEQDKLEHHLSFLATVGSTSPYVGLFGTVWGIMTAFHALGNVTQATIAMVAPGISEALIATAMGLFAAIPAVIAYNRFADQADRISNSYTMFQEEFSSILHRQTM